ncbi:multiubiquitin domain-containing protein [Brevundimonas sp.]|uniref:multiubiquitin domain-containing protein n=1 Tax=Brevundimonas sp. TaxID=1871086 RepID=UPI0025BDDEBD|nr:multiubiquitin domain-containing protein [Brevundimonas sp.]
MADNGKKTYRLVVNGQPFETRDQIEEGRDILQLAGLSPASDHVLIQLTRPGSKAIGLDVEVDLGEPGREDFRAFESDRSFNFTVDEIGYAWGSASITETELRDIVGTPPNKVLYLEREDEGDEVLEEGAVIDLEARGAEEFRTGKRSVTVYYRDDPFDLERRVYTGAELVPIFGVPDGYQLDLVKPHGFDEIASDRRIKVRDGMHFVSHPPCGQSS